MARFTRLSALTLGFSSLFFEEYSHQNPSEELILQRQILQTIAENALPPSLLSLSLLNIVPLPDGVFRSDSFHRFMAIPEKVTVSVNPGHAGADRDCYACFKQFMREEFSPHLLEPASHSLTSLTLINTSYTLWFAGPPFQDLYFPHLARLSLDRFLLKSVDDFIVRHKATLTQLHLEECAMEAAEDYTPLQTWSAFWTALWEAPVLLVFLEVWPDEGIYVSESPDGSGLEEVEDYELPEDSDALQHMRALVKARAD